MLTAQSDWLLTHGIITERTHNRLCDVALLRKLASHLISSNGLRPRGKKGLQFKLLTLRHYHKGDFDMTLIVPKLKTKKKWKGKRLQCFVGHRDSQKMRRSFQFDLATILREFRITPKFQDVNYLTDVIFNSVVKEIKRSDLCIFDNRDTLNKPNVYIEIGIAKAFGKPVVFFEKVAKSGEQLTGFPSDFSGLSTFRYKSYKKLFFEFGLQLPVLMRDMGFSTS